MTQTRSLGLLVLLWVHGCATTHPTKPSERAPINVHASLSATPVLGTSGDRTVHVMFHDASGQPDAASNETLLEVLRTRGYHAVTDADQASIRVDITLLRVDIGHVSDSDVAIAGGQKVALLAVLNGPTASARAADHANPAVLGDTSALRGAADFSTGALMHEVRFTAIADIDIRENSKTAASNTTAIHPSSTTHHLRGWVTASGLNLTQDESQPRIRQALVQSVAGLFR